MTGLIDKFEMQTNFEGLIQLLAKSLYPEPEVFIRELIQNAHDGIIRRKQDEKDLAGHIEINLDRTNGIISVTDNGIGMDENDIKTFLSVIGSTGTGSAIKEFEEKGLDAALGLIGQFGIGLLSAFVVAHKIVVHTLKIGSSQAYSWHNTGTTECELYSDDRKKFGTSIDVYISPQYSYMIEARKTKECVIKYCDLIPYPIFIDNEGPINTIEAPFYKKHWDSDSEKDVSYKSFLRHRYPNDIPLDIIPINVIEPYRAEGVLYISDRNLFSMGANGVLDIYVRRMFIRSNDNEFLPEWAKFVRGIIDSPDLDPTAARDNIKRNTPAYNFLKQALGDIIVQRLTFLYEKEPSKFRQINTWHHHHLKGMAYYHDEFFDKVADKLLFESNQGPMSLEEYMSKNSARADKNGKIPIYYFSYSGGAGQFFRLADAQGWVVLNAGYIFEEPLLKEFSKKNAKTVYLERLDATDDSQLFERLTPAEEEKFQQFEMNMEVELKRFGIQNISVRIRRFLPIDLPSVIIHTPETEAEEKLYNYVTQPWFMDGLEDIAHEALKQRERRTVYLTLNANNSLIQSLAGEDFYDVAVKEILFGLYNIAILYSQNFLNKNSSNVIHDQVVKMLDRLLAQHQQIVNSKQALEKERCLILELRKKQRETEIERPVHIRLFMITPFAEKYSIVESAIRHIFESSPYFFEIQLARDYNLKPGLLDNVRGLMLQAHGFIAEISNQSPNVMFELGAAMMPNDNRPVFALKDNSSTLPIPADFREQLYIPYGSLDDSIQKIEDDIRSSFERDGRIIHDGINQLLELRKKRFLSRTVLEGLKFILSDSQIKLIMSKYVTIEDLLSNKQEVLMKELSLEDFEVNAILGQLKKFK